MQNLKDSSFFAPYLPEAERLEKKLKKKLCLSPVALTLYGKC